MLADLLFVGQGWRWWGSLCGGTGELDAEWFVAYFLAEGGDLVIKTVFEGHIINYMWYPIYGYWINEYIIKNIKDKTNSKWPNPNQQPQQNYPSSPYSPKSPTYLLPPASNLLSQQTHSNPSNHPIPIISSSILSY